MQYFPGYHNRYSDYAISRATEELWFDFRQEQTICRFISVHISSEPPPHFINRVVGALSLGVKRSGQKSHHSHQSCLRSHGIQTHNFLISIRSCGSPVYMVRDVFERT